jgi:PIN domain nuclease of toxin-antitoxin system
VRFLLDTHALLWALADDPILDPDAREAIIDGRNMVFVSAASAWEITVKKRLGKLEAPDDLDHQLARHRFTPLDITVRHALLVEHLPELHRDPFDRVLIAQARAESLTILTRDEHIPRYDVPCRRA